MNIIDAIAVKARSAKVVEQIRTHLSDMTNDQKIDYLQDILDTVDAVYDKVWENIDDIAEVCSFDVATTG